MQGLTDGWMEWLVGELAQQTDRMIYGYWVGGLADGWLNEWVDGGVAKWVDAQVC